MFKLIYQSDTIKYLKPEEWAGVPTGTGLGSLYNGWLVTPPRIYAEALDSGLNFKGVWILPSESVAGSGTIYASAWMRQIYWPGWAVKTHKWDAASGKYLGFVSGVPAGYYSSAAFQMPDGTVWSHTVFGEIYQLDIVGTQYGFLFEASSTPAWAKYGEPGWSPGPFMVHRAINRCITNSGTGRTLHVREWSTGTILRSIEPGGYPQQIVGVDDRRAYVLCRSGIMNLIDYSNGRVLSSLRCPVAPTLVPYTVATWDKQYNRLLFLTYTPDATDGACTSVIKGFYPVPLATAISEPIPLTPLRKDRESPILVRSWGDAGEPVGTQIKLSSAGDTTVVRGLAQTDGQGDAVFVVKGTTAGDTDLTATCTVPDTTGIVNDPNSY